MNYLGSKRRTSPAMEVSTFELMLLLMWKRFENIYLAFSIICSFLITYLLPSPNSVAFLAVFVFVSRLIEIVFFVQMTHIAMSATTASNNLFLSKAYDQIADSTDSSSIDEKLEQAVQVLNRRHAEKMSEAQALFDPKNLQWAAGYFVFIIPAALGYWFH